MMPQVNSGNSFVRLMSVSSVSLRSHRFHWTQRRVQMGYEEYSTKPELTFAPQEKSDVCENHVQPKDFPDNLLLLQDERQGVRSIFKYLSDKWYPAARLSPWDGLSRTARSYQVPRKDDGDTDTETGIADCWSESYHTIPHGTRVTRSYDCCLPAYICSLSRAAPNLNSMNGVRQADVSSCL